MLRKNKPSSGPACVLIARLSAIGDVAMTVPVVYSACRSNPDTRFVFLTKKSNASIFADQPANLTVISPELDGRHKGVKGMNRLAADIVAQWHPDCFADLHDVLRTRLLGIFLRLRGVPGRVIDKGRAAKRRLVSRGAISCPPLTSQIERYATVFRKLGISLEAPFDCLWGGHAKAPGEHPSEPYVVVAPFAAHPGKIYPAPLMEAVIRGLADAGLKVLIMGAGGSEQQTAEKWADAIPGVTSLAGKRLGFTRELEIMNHAAATVAMDSGNMHLSAIAGTPTISIWGATHPSAGFSPWCQEQGILQATMPCRPCSVYGKTPCRFGSQPACMEAIRPDMIIQKVLDTIRIKNG